MARPAPSRKALRVGAGESDRGGDDESQIRRLVAAFREAWNRHDAAAMAALFSDDAEFTSWRGARVGGRVGVRTYHAEAFRMRYAESVLHVDGVQVRILRPEVATVDVWWSITGSKFDTGTLRPPRRGVTAIVATHDGEERPWELRIVHHTEVPRDAPGPPE
jgi:uncharacterized protein (TIGR02246 family)